MSEKLFKPSYKDGWIVVMENGKGTFAVVSNPIDTWDEAEQVCRTLNEIADQFMSAIIQSSIHKALNDILGPTARQN